MLRRPQNAREVIRVSWPWDCLGFCARVLALERVQRFLAVVCVCDVCLAVCPPLARLLGDSLPSRVSHQDLLVCTALV
jgi:hypothetical protein